MKRFMITCAVVLGISVAASAQGAAQPDKATPVSKTAYQAKVKELDKAIVTGKMEQAEKLFGEVNNLVNDEMKVVRYQIRDAANETEKAKYIELVKTQRGLFSNAMNIRQSGAMATNREALIKALNDFGDTIE